MKRVGTKAVWTLAIAVLWGLAALSWLSCREDVFVEQPKSLAGDYDGIYYYRLNDPLNPNQRPDSQFVRWKFTTAGYNFTLDADKQPDRRFCDAFGTYELTDALLMEQVRGNSTNQTCDSTRNPFGRFVILEQTDERVRIVQTEGIVTKEVILTRREL